MRHCAIIYVLLSVYGIFVTIRQALMGFYVGYFRQKQINLGKDPDEVLREEFPRTWWIIR